MSKTPKAKSQTDLYQEITNTIISALDQGTVPWRKPWRENGQHRNLQSNRTYRGLNTLLTEVAALKHGYTSPFWTTFKAASKAGGTVKKGEKGTTITFWKFLEVEDEDDSDKINRIPLLRIYKVFNTDQCEGLTIPELEAFDNDPNEECEKVIKNMPNAPKIQEGPAASYNPRSDVVSLPPMKQFEEAEGYYATAFHELTHSTGHKTRLDRDLSTNFGSEKYSREELTAELGSAFLAARTGIGTDTLDMAASYIDGWRKFLTDDIRAIVVASGKAQRAADYIYPQEQS